ncbi:hypothetical protein BH20ACI1_BH20ACI1_15840 [soil metagenome]
MNFKEQEMSEKKENLTTNGNVFDRENIADNDFLNKNNY